MSLMSLTLYNTRTRQKEPFVPLPDGEVTMYVCGPTVYSFPHIGNARPAVVFDVLARLLRTRYRLTYARNITDIDDKINKAAAEQGVPIGEIAARFAAVYLEDMARPRCHAAGPGAPRYGACAGIIAMIAALIAPGPCLRRGGPRAVPGALLRRLRRPVGPGPARPAGGRPRRGRALQGGRRRFRAVEALHVRICPAGTAPGAGAGPAGTSSAPPWSTQHLGPTIDIHGGGNDLIFPHHENEMAQSTCAHDGQLFVRYWLHNGFVNVDHTKMSKSLATCCWSGTC